MKRSRPLPLAAAILSLGAVALSCVMIATRIARYNREQGRVVYAFLTVEEPQFTYAGRAVRVDAVPPAGPADPGALAVVYGDDRFTVPVSIPPGEHADELPGLTRYDDWFKIVRFAPLTGRSWDDLMRAMEAGEEPDRLVVVTRSLRPGVNPETWGNVWRKDWIFDFHEFQPAGGFTHDRFAYPTSRTAEQLAQQRAQEAEHPGTLPELDPRSWQFQIADLLMPQGTAPRIVAGDSPLAAVGWWFPAAILSVFAATGALLLAFAPARAAAPPPAAP